MGSINAQRLAQKITEKSRRGEKVVLYDTLKEVGYSENTALQPSRITRTLSFKKAMELESRPVIEQLEKLRQKIITALHQKDLSQEEVRTLAGSLDIVNKNVHLLNGGNLTTNVFVLPSEVMEKNRIREANASKGVGDVNESGV